MGKLKVNRHDKDHDMIELWESNSQGDFLIAAVHEDSMSSILSVEHYDALSEGRTLTFKLVEEEVDDGNKS